MRGRPLTRPAGALRDHAGARHRRGGSSRRAAAVVLFALAVPVSLLSATVDRTDRGVPAPVGAGPGGAAGPLVPLPFDLPTAAALQASPRRVFAHYFPPLPVSLDNRPPDEDYYTRQYLTRKGEGGKHLRYGGYLRDRPLPRPPLGEDWRSRDMRTEVRQALSGGLDGFAVDIIQAEDGADPRLWENVRLLLQAADDVGEGFQVMLMPDMSGSLADKSPQALAERMARLAEYDSAYRLPDGRLVVSPFKAEEHDAEWWEEFLEAMRERHDIDVAFLPVFLDERPHADSFRSISYGMSVWGSRNPRHNDLATALERVSAVREDGQRWMQPVSVQDERPYSGVYDEAENTRNLRLTWRIARESGAELVQLPTWNDYTEGTQLAPSVMHGWSFLDINAYYLTWYKTGTPPPVVRDTVYVTHRLQPYAAEPSKDQRRLMLLRGGSPARDTVEALTFLTEPGTVTVRSGGRSTTCAVEAGVDTCLVDLAPGRVSAVVERRGRTVAEVVSPHPVTERPEVQDLQYVAASSRRGDARPAAERAN